MSNFLGALGNGPKCNMCNRTVIELIPLYDNDQKHKNTQCCLKCKKAIKNGETIEKYTMKVIKDE